MSSPTARAAMTQLKATGLVEMPDTTTETEEKQITLKDDFNWFLGEEFAKLRERFEPVDNTKEMREHKEQQQTEKDEGSDETETALELNDGRCLKEKCPPTTVNSRLDPKPKPPLMGTCSKCGVEMEAYYLNRTHMCEGTD